MYCCILQTRATDSTLYCVLLHYMDKSYWQYLVQCTTLYRQELLRASYIMYRFIITVRATDCTLCNVPLQYRQELLTAPCTMYRFIIQTRATKSTLYNVPPHYYSQSYWQYPVQCTASMYRQYRQGLLTVPCAIYRFITQTRVTNSTLYNVPLHYYSQSYWQYSVQCTASIYRKELLTAPCTMYCCNVQSELLTTSCTIYQSIIQSELLTTLCRMCQFSQYPQPFRTPTWSLHTS